MDTLSSKKSLYLHKMKSTKTKIDFADISTFDIAPTPPKEPKPEARKLHRRHRVPVQKLNTYEAKYELKQDTVTQIYGTEHGNESVPSDLLGARDPAFPWYCPTPRTANMFANKEPQDNVAKTTFEDQRKFTSRNEAVNANPIRYPVPGPREQLTPNPFPINKNKLAPLVDPKKNVVAKPPHKGPCPVKAKHMPVYKESVKATVIDQPTRTSLPVPVDNPNPIRYPAPGPREQLTPSLFPVNKNKLAPVVDPKKNVVAKPPRKGPRPVKARHMPIYTDNTESSCMLTQIYGCRDDYVADSVIPVMKNSRPIRYPSPGPREQLLPNPFPVNKKSLPPLIKHGRVVAPMCG